MSHVEFKKKPCHMSLFFGKPCRMSLSPMSHGEFKKWPCRPVEFRGRGPSESTCVSILSHTADSASATLPTMTTGESDAGC